MAKQTITKILDDITGEEADETVRFSLDETAYEIDLTSEHASELRVFLSRFIDAGTRTGRVSGAGAQMRPYARQSGRVVPAPRTLRDREENQAIRDWAEKNGYEVAARGRIQQSVVDAYHQRHAAEALAKEAAVQQAAVAAPKPRRRAPAAGKAEFAAAP